MTKKIEAKIIRYPAVAAILSFFIASLLSDNLIASIAMAIVSFIAGILAQKIIPQIKSRKNSELMERDLPFALLSISVDLGLNISFEKCIFNASKTGLSTASEFKKVFFEIKNRGSSVEAALNCFSKRTGSIAVKRAVLQLIRVYENGQNKTATSLGSSENVRRIAIEMLAKQRAQSKEFSGKLVVFSLMFIAVSAIIPALFQSFVIAGSAVLKIDFSIEQIFGIITLGFPALDCLVLFYIRSKTPAFLRA